MTYEIPTEGYIPFLDVSIPIHWDNHAILMFGLWFILVPAMVLLLRFGKVPPTKHGIPGGTPKFAWPELPWTLHKIVLYSVIIMSIGGAGFAILLSGRFSGTLHAFFGVATIVLGALQGLTAWYRGSHGGQRAPTATHEDRATWGGDHFDMTPQRWWFEAYHKTAGYFVLFCAGGAVATGLSQYWMPSIAVAFFVIVLLALILAVILQGRGHKHDTYQSVYGRHPDHPFNKRRYAEMFEDKDEKL
jgi:hypothetical protein